MSLYTSIYFTPTDRSWITPPEFIRRVADMLGVSAFDHFTVYREVSTDQTLEDDERYEEMLSQYNFPIEDGLPRLHADSGYWTHMMFPYRDFMKSLMAEVAAALPESLSRGFAPWDTSFYHGRWTIFSYDNGTLIDSGACAFTMSANGRPFDSDQYLERFMAVEGVSRFRRQLEHFSKQSWTAVINLT